MECNPCPCCRDHHTPTLNITLASQPLSPINQSNNIMYSDCVHTYKLGLHVYVTPSAHHPTSLNAAKGPCRKMKKTKKKVALFAQQVLFLWCHNDAVSLLSVTLFEVNKKTKSLVLTMASNCPTTNCN